MSRWLPLALCLLLGCSSATPLRASFPRGASDLERWLTAARAHEQPAQEALIVGVSEGGREIFVYDLARRRLRFRQPALPLSLPYLAGRLVVVAEAERLRLLDVRDGSLVQTIPLAGMRLVGADGDEAITAIALSAGGPLKARSRLLLVRGGELLADHQLDTVIGGPAVLGGFCFVPHHRVSLSVLSERGDELARLQIREDVASQAFAHEREVYFGQLGMYHVSPALTEEGGRERAYFRPALVHKLPGSPAFLPDTSLEAPAPESALHRVRLSFLPAPRAEGLALAEDTLYLAYYRLLFALSPTGESARFVRVTESDAVGLQAIAGGLVAVESSGRVSFVGATGVEQLRVDMGLRVSAARIRAERLAASGPGEAVASISTQLEQAARDPDSRLVPARALAVALLGSVPDEQAVAALLALCADESSPTRVRSQACTSLSARSQPSELMLAALGEHADYLSPRPAPPLAALAAAVRRAGDRRAVPNLLAQLSDPATPDEALVELLRALGDLGGAADAPAVAAFLRLYHADARSDSDEATLGVAMDAVAQLDPELARSVLAPLAVDTLARAGVRAGAQKRLDALGPPAELAPPPDQGERPAPSDTEGVSPSPTPAAATEPPSQLTAQHIDEVLAPVRTKLSNCVRAAPEHPASARLTLVIEGDGTLRDLRTLPESVRSCIDPLVRELRFPETRYGRRSVMSYVVPR